MKTTIEDIIQEMRIDMFDGCMPVGEIESCLNHWGNKYLIIRLMEREYSEEDMVEYSDYCWKFSKDNRYKSPLSPKEWFESFKNKTK